ncbi:MAG: type II toxin-antitoxin system Phd/YefM family antitoxin [Gammaproteobacteria bacterium]
MNEITANRFRDQLKSAVDRAIREHRPLRVTRRRGGDFVVLSADDWSAIEETLYLNRMPGMVKSIKSAAKEPLAKGTGLKDLSW